MVWYALALLLGILLGFLAGTATNNVMERREEERIRSRDERRALLGLPDRPPRRPDAAGSARVFRADWAERREDSGMQQ